MRSGVTHSACLNSASTNWRCFPREALQIERLRNSSLNLPMRSFDLVNHRKSERLLPCPSLAERSQLPTTGLPLPPDACWDSASCSVPNSCGEHCPINQLRTK